MKSLATSPSGAELKQAHSFWVNRETRRRLLLGSFILDTQQAILFEQKPVLFPRWPSEASPTQISTLPCPCDNDLWECGSIDEWADLAKNYQHMNLAEAANLTFYASTNALDAFRSHLILAYLSTHRPSSEIDPQLELSAFSDHLSNQSSNGCYKHSQFDIHAYTALQNTPLRTLLTVSGESWLFGKKLQDQEDFCDAKTKLREWVCSSQSQTALLHATSLLRIALRVDADDSRSDPEQEVNMLHEQWCVYVAALVCWACAFSASSSTLRGTAAPSIALQRSPRTPASSGTKSMSMSTAAGYPPLMDPVEAEAQMRWFLRVADVDDAGTLPGVLEQATGRTTGLLEVVRMRKLDASLGGLLNEASGVLYRLVEGRSGLSHF
jgi:Fungal specific transcription factor domain